MKTCFDIEKQEIISPPTNRTRTTQVGTQDLCNVVWLLAFPRDNSSPGQHEEIHESSLCKLLLWFVRRFHKLRNTAYRETCKEISERMRLALAWWGETSLPTLSTVGLWFLTDLYFIRRRLVSYSVSGWLMCAELHIRQAFVRRPHYDTPVNSRALVFPQSWGPLLSETHPSPRSGEPMSAAASVRRAILWSFGFRWFVASLGWRRTADNTTPLDSRPAVCGALFYVRYVVSWLVSMTAIYKLYSTATDLARPFGVQPLTARRWRNGRNQVRLDSGSRDGWFQDASSLIARFFDSRFIVDGTRTTGRRRAGDRPSSFTETTGNWTLDETEEKKMGEWELKNLRITLIHTPRTTVQRSIEVFERYDHLRTALRPSDRRVLSCRFLWPVKAWDLYKPRQRPALSEPESLPGRTPIHVFEILLHKLLNTRSRLQPSIW